MTAILQVLRDVQTSLAPAGPQLRVTTARTMTQIQQCLAPAGAADPPELLVFAVSQKDAACLDDLLLLSGRNPRLRILLLVRQDAFAQISYRCRKYAIHVFTLPMRRQILSEVIRVILSMRTQLLLKEEELTRLTKKVNEIGCITKAKCLLIEKRRMTENEAHHFLEREAMDRSISRREVANEIIRKYSADA